jgi:hypothetical protein
VVMNDHPKAQWFRLRALDAIGLALGAGDARIKRLHAAEAERWLRLTQLKSRPEMQDDALTAAE